MRAPWIVGLALLVASPDPRAAAITLAPDLPEPVPALEPDRLHPSHTWSALATLSPGHRIAVVTKRQRVLEGLFEGYAAEVIMLAIEGEPVVVRRSDVAEVLSLQHSNRVRNTMLSWGAGFAVGLILGTAGEATADEDRVADTAAAASTGTGRAVRAMLPNHRVVYRVPTPRP